MDIQNVKNKGVKLTKHKIAILDLFNIHKHLDATQIYNILINNGINISLATIYRVLTNFERNDIIEKHNFNNEHAIYELVKQNEHHDHLICIKCHNVFEFIDEKIEHLQNEIAKANNFKIVSHSLNIYGICNNCQISS